MEKKSVMKRVYEGTILILTIIFLAIVLFQAGCWLMPDRVTYGSVWSSYLREPEDSIDVLFLGSSRAYCNIMPGRLFEKTGTTSYVMAGPSQTIPLTYYYLRECLKTQHPKLILMEISLTYANTQGSYSMANVCYMPPSWNRIMAASTCEEGIMKIALFPLEEFHSRIYEVLSTSKTGLFKERGNMMLCGYTPLYKSRTQRELVYQTLRVSPGDETYNTNFAYLEKIAKLCEQEGIQCVFFHAPTMEPFPPEASERLFSDLRQLPCTAAEEWGGLIDEIGIDAETDWYDELHFNTNGAWKFTDYLSEYITSLGIPKSENVDAELWEKRVQSDIDTISYAKENTKSE